MSAVLSASGNVEDRTEGGFEIGICCKEQSSEIWCN